LSNSLVVAAVGDTHLPRGSRRLPDECLRRLREADLILHTGDHSSLASLEELRALGPRVHAVFGNVDEPALRAQLPEELVVAVEDVRIGVTHVPGPRQRREERLLQRFPGCDAVVYGHTHTPQVERCGAAWILNPGSPTERRRSPRRTMLELRIHGKTIEPSLIQLP
jgi:putative phosphoesterase